MAEAAKQSKSAKASHTPRRMPLVCEDCGGEGRIWKSEFGGNDPNVWDAGECEACNGSGDTRCVNRKCPELAVGFNDDGEALCEGCLAKWATDYLTEAA